MEHLDTLETGMAFNFMTSCLFVIKVGGTKVSVSRSSADDLEESAGSMLQAPVLPDFNVPCCFPLSLATAQLLKSKRLF